MAVIGFGGLASSQNPRSIDWRLVHIPGRSWQRSSRRDLEEVELNATMSLRMALSPAPRTITSNIFSIIQRIADLSPNFPQKVNITKRRRNSNRTDSNQRCTESRFPWQLCRNSENYQKA